MITTEIPDAVDTSYRPTEPCLAHRDEPGDESLISAIAGGAVWAVEALYQRYSGLLYSLAAHMVADRQLAEELVQDAFLAVWRRAESYTSQAGAVRVWLISIVRHRAIDYLRSASRRPVLSEPPLEHVDEQIWSPDVWDEVWRIVQSAEIRAALMQIPSEQRMVIELAYFQGWTHSEIAEGCQLPLGTVKGRLRCGLKNLRLELEKSGILGIE